MSKRRSTSRSAAAAPPETPLPVLLADEDVPQGVLRALFEAGFHVRDGKVELPRGTIDADVVRYASAIDAVTVTFNRRDFDKLVGRVAQHRQHHRNRKARGAIYIECPKPDAEQRVRRVAEILVDEARRAERREDRRIFVRITVSEVAIRW